MPSFGILARYIRDACGFWLIFRICAALLSFTAGAGARHASLGQSLWVIWMTCVVLLIDVAIRRERVLLANLGISTTRLVTTIAIPPLVGEVVWQFASRAV